jgi:peroxiredoxin Q/BCP
MLPAGASVRASARWLRHLLGPLLAVALGTALLAAANAALALGGELPPVGQAAPVFRLAGVAPAIEGQGPADETAAVREVSLGLDDFHDHWLVLYFYPRDFTDGCTLEARGFQRDLHSFRDRGAEVVGISADDPDSHRSFCGSEGLAFPLLSDPGGAVSRRYGSWLAPYSLRHTFLIDPEGVLRARWTAVRPSGHSSEVLASLTALQVEGAAG